MTIDTFDGEFRFLSNFFIEPDGTCVEHEFQAAKTDDPEWKERILSAPTPGKAKRLGRKAPLRDDWEDAKLDVMRLLVLQKFQDHKELGDRLLATGHETLVEGNHWGDTFWGICDGEGENWLGIILMWVRMKLRQPSSDGLYGR